MFSVQPICSQYLLWTRLENTISKTYTKLLHIIIISRPIFQGGHTSISQTNVYYSCADLLAVHNRNNRDTQTKHNRNTDNGVRKYCMGML